jgi:hypothetical protein
VFAFMPTVAFILASDMGVHGPRQPLGPITFWLIVGIGGIAFISYLANRKELDDRSKGKYDKRDSMEGSKQERGPDNLKASEFGPRKRCVDCNEEIPADAKVCPKCGWTQPA